MNDVVFLFRLGSGFYVAGLLVVGLSAWQGYNDAGALLCLAGAALSYVNGRIMAECFRAYLTMNAQISGAIERIKG